MSRWRSDMAAARRHEFFDSRAFHPIPIVSVDLDEAIEHDVRLDPEAVRSWVEVSRHGRVVGRTELTPRGGILSAGELAELSSQFPDEGHDAPEAGDQDLPFASVIVPTICRNPELLLRTVRSLLALDYPRFEVLVVDNSGESDSPLPPLPGGDRVTVLTEPRRGVSRARNCGLRSATGEFVAFTDDDAVVDPKWLRGFGARFAVDRRVAAIGGLVLPQELSTAPQLWFEEFYGGFSQSYAPFSQDHELTKDDPLFPYNAGRFGAGVNMAFRRDAIERLGGFDVHLGAGTPARGGEDLSIFVRFVDAGETVGFEPASLVRHTHRLTKKEFLRQVHDYGVGLTAMYASLMARDRRHLRAMVRRIPSGVRLLVRPREVRSVSLQPSYPRRTILVQVAGMAVGPFAYRRSKRRAEKQS